MHYHIVYGDGIDGARPCLCHRGWPCHGTNYSPCRQHRRRCRSSVPCMCVLYLEISKLLMFMYKANLPRTGGGNGGGAGGAACW